jgi:hypothetical protein
MRARSASVNSRDARRIARRAKWRHRDARERARRAATARERR